MLKKVKPADILNWFVWWILGFGMLASILYLIREYLLKEWNLIFFFGVYLFLSWYFPFSRDFYKSQIKNRETFEILEIVFPALVFSYLICFGIVFQLG